MDEIIEVINSSEIDPIPEEIVNKFHSILDRLQKIPLGEDQCNKVANKLSYVCGEFDKMSNNTWNCFIHINCDIKKISLHKTKIMQRGEKFEQYEKRLVVRMLILMDLLNQEKCSKNFTDPQNDAALEIDYKGDFDMGLFNEIHIINDKVRQANNEALQLCNECQQINNEIQRLCDKHSQCNRRYQQLKKLQKIVDDLKISTINVEQ
ncbi:MAG: hypothetical protein LBH49_00545 [Puniceicoccales bacterium]|jgi:hypothetical protein|nr:hypothetical protein [Puniceicoccales bacterium]